ncbi:MAG TPA: FAD-linked oxidase C-terminal domain-containing protein [Trueperaceae bacterium]
MMNSRPAAEPVGSSSNPSANDDELIAAIERELDAAIEGEVRFDAKARSLYSTDASPYEIWPLGVVLPRSTNDIRTTLEVARRYGASVLPRGGGTSLAGQTVGRSIVVDVSKYLTEIIEFDEAGRTVKVQPGVVRDQLNSFLAPYGLQFTPDVSTTNRANIGGMVANNSAGTRSIKYGKTVDQVVAMTVMLLDGTLLELRQLERPELDAKLAQADREGDIYRTVHTIVTEHEDEIEARFPKVMRRVGGYNLDEFTGGKPFNLAKLVCGSEGTLAFIVDVTLRLQPIPTHRMLALLHFETLDSALRAVQYINRHGPSAVEILDDIMFELGLTNPAMAPLMHWLEGQPAAVLMVEFDGASEEEMLAGYRSLRADRQVTELSYHVYEALSPIEQRDVLELRRAGLGIYATVKGRHKPVPFIEDAAIPAENLPEYLPQVIEVCRRRGVRIGIYGHASVGVIHVRPMLDLKTVEGVEQYRQISEEVFELVKRYGGSWSGEHGDGLIRSYQNRRLFGDLLYEDFREIKRAFDPDWLMNPGKIVDSPPMTENLRYGPDYPQPDLDTVFDFSAEGGFLAAAEACTGVGACRKVGTGTMCPSYMATRDEDHSTRGRANILREAMTGRLPGGLASKDVYEVLDLCLECKACKAECPSQVDVAKLKYEFLQHYHDEHGTPLPVVAMGNVGRVAPVARVFAPIVNALLPLKPVRWLVEKLVQVDRRRVLPTYARQSFAGWFAGRERRRATALGVTPQPAHEEADRTDAPRGPVALFADTWTMYNEPNIGKAAVEVLERLGYEVELVPYGCCGRPQISKGLLREARRMAKSNVERLQGYVARGVPVVGLEPSCVTAFKDDYRDLVPGETTEAVADSVWMIDQFLAREWTQGRLEPADAFSKGSTPMMLHGHCQQRAILGTGASRAVLGWVSSDVHEVDSGCCGMAGSFGYGHYDVSMAIGEQRLFPAVREHRGETVACGFSCRHQIRDGTGQRSKHISEVLAEALR